MKVSSMKDRRKVERHIGEERRKSVRASTSLWVEGKKDDAVYFERLSNLSTGGVFIEQQIPHPIGSRLKLKIELPENIGGPVILSAKVISHEGDPSGMHIKFLDCDEETITKIDSFLDSITN